jgi:hypothetical protein
LFANQLRTLVRLVPLCGASGELLGDFSGGTAGTSPGRCTRHRG